jgi:hypothetical protein
MGTFVFIIGIAILGLDCIQDIFTVQRKTPLRLLVEGAPAMDIDRVMKLGYGLPAEGRELGVGRLPKAGNWELGIGNSEMGDGSWELDASSFTKI